MITYLSRLTSERDSLTQAATELAERAAREERDLSPTELDSLASWQTRCAEIDTQLSTLNAQTESTRAYARLRDAIEEVEPPARVTRLATREATEPQGWGELFIESDAFREYPGAGTSRRVTVPFSLEERAAIETGDLGTALPRYTYTPAVYTFPSPLLDVVGKVTTGAGSVQWVQWAPNPQTAASLVAEGELKPEAVMTPTVVADALETYAHWKGITRQALEDIPQIRSLVENRLRQGITVALEDAVTDALQAAPIPAVTGSAAAGDDLLSTIRVAVGTVQGAGYGSPNAVLLNPADWAALDIATVGNAGGAGGQSGFWGMRAIAVPALPAGTAYVGNFQTAVQLFSRGSADVFLTDSHADFFIRNVLVLLAEIRALATVPDPLAAAKVTVGAVAARSES